MNINLTQRPQSLAEVAFRINQSLQNKDYAIAEFIDHFKTLDLRGKEQALAVEPEVIKTESDNILNAYLAGIAEYFSATNDLKSPKWTNNSDRFLKIPFFANSGLESLNPMLTVESPAPFRRRMIFTERVPFRRA